MQSPNLRHVVTLGDESTHLQLLPVAVFAINSCSDANLVLSVQRSTFTVKCTCQLLDRYSLLLLIHRSQSRSQLYHCHR